MKGGKDEEKIMGPLFPRFHVNDTEKGGPRAPPRNKMALYEQLSVPSQRINSGLASTLPLPPNNAGSSVHSASSSQGGDRKRSVFSPLYISHPTPARLPEKHQSCSSDGVNLNATMDVEWKSMKNASYRTMNATLTPEFNMSHPHDFSDLNDCQKKLVDEDDVRVPTFVNLVVTPRSSKNCPVMDKERVTPFSPTHPGCSTVILGNSLLNTAAATSSLSVQTQNSRDKHPKQTSTAAQRARQQARNHSEENLKGSVTSRDCAEKPASHPSTRENITEPLEHANGSANQGRPRSLEDDFRRVCDTDRSFHRESRSGFLQVNTACGDGVSIESMGVEKGPRVQSESCSRASRGGSHRSPDEAENGNEYRENNFHRSLQVGDVDRNDDVSETSMVDSISGMDISPDDVVGVIGQKHFWKARKAIANQQRVFAVQVFELHRLIKVQKLIAGSPHLLLEDNRYLRKPILKVSSAKKLTSEYVLKSPPETVKQKDDPQKPNQSTECASENAAKKLTLPSLNNGTNSNTGLISQHSSCGPHSGNPPPAPMATDNKVGPWYFHPPPGNQWLVPIMSPSEGLVYKPYAGPCPPTAGFMAPVYGGCASLSVAGDFMNPVYGVPATHQQGICVIPGTPPVGQTYFSPYGVPVMSPVISASAVEQANPLAGTRPQGQSEQLSTGEVNFNMYQQSSCNYSNQKSEAVPSCIKKFQTSKDSELQGSTASSPTERAQGAGGSLVTEGRDALPLFPMVPAVQVSDRPPQTHSIDQHTQVIRVVPHNPRSATESAARIFQSIQKERQQYDSV